MGFLEELAFLWAIAVTTQTGRHVLLMPVLAFSPMSPDFTPGSRYLTGHKQSLGLGLEIRVWQEVVQQMKTTRRYGRPGQPLRWDRHTWTVVAFLQSCPALSPHLECM